MSPIAQALLVATVALAIVAAGLVLRVRELRSSLREMQDIALDVVFHDALRRRTHDRVVDMLLGWMLERRTLTTTTISPTEGVVISQERFTP